MQVERSKVVNNRNIQSRNLEFHQQ